MKSNPRVVFDTNIYISALVFGGNPNRCLDLAKEHTITLFVSHAILLELGTKLYEKFSYTSEEVKRTFRNIGRYATIVIPKSRLSLISDEPDNRILECAKEANADYIVSGDKKHLLSLKKFEGIPILSATAFLQEWYHKN